jgi:formate-dependent nitrite reductase cytochrome c552 subunit
LESEEFIMTYKLVEKYLVEAHPFCAGLLKEVMKDVNKHVSKAEIKNAHAFKNSAGYEFHGPKEFYVFLGTKVDCLSSAKAEGWSRYLKKIGVKGY